ncbi:MAG: hypothetical protein KF775_16880 [Cyclobacteriaceae bacterium]|nr:hypothetical protein [Cyclobacteriaceae bacterium]
MHAPYAEPPPTTPVPAVARLLFATFKIARDSNATVITLMSKHLVKGTHKSDPETSTATNRLQVVQLNQDGTELTGYYLGHPLRKNVEYLNEHQEYSTRWVELPEAEFFIRVALEPTCVYLVVYEVNGSDKLKLLSVNVNEP